MVWKWKCIHSPMCCMQSCCVPFTSVLNRRCILLCGRLRYYQDHIDMMKADWSSLPDEIIDQFSSKLDCLGDLVAFSAVCRSWYTSYKRVKSGCRPQVPWLMSVMNVGDEPACGAKLYDPSAPGWRSVELPPGVAVCWGTPYGWIIALGVNNDIFMFNPLTKEQMKLPHADTLPDVEEDQELQSFGHTDEAPHVKRVCRTVVHRIILLKVPYRRGNNEADEGIFLAVAICGPQTAVGIARPNDSEWQDLFFESMIDLEHDSENYMSMRAIDAAYWKGGLYILCENGSLLHCELSDGDIKDIYLGHVCLDVLDYAPGPEGIEIDDYSDALYLAESSSGDLLLIQRVRELQTIRQIDPCILEAEPDEVYRTCDFLICKLNSNNNIWELTEDLGSITMFVGANSTMTIDASDADSAHRRNCIFYTDDHWGYWMEPECIGIRDCGVFSADMKTLIHQEPYLGTDSSAGFYCPLWFIPKI